MTGVQTCALPICEPVLVTGKLRIREYVKDEQRRFSAEIEAATVGHDLTRGVAHFQRVQRAGIATSDDRQEAEAVSDIWLRETYESASPGETDRADDDAGPDVEGTEGGDLAFSEVPESRYAGPVLDRSTEDGDQEGDGEGGSHTGRAAA